MNALFIFFSRLSRRTQNFSSVAAGTAHPKSPAHLSSPDSQAPPVREFIRVHSCPFVPLEPRRGLSNYPTQHTPEPCPLIQSGTGILPVTSPASTSEDVCPIVRPWEVVANRVGSDIVSGRQSYPLNFRQLEENDAQPNAPFADGYSTRYSEIINC